MRSWAGVALAAPALFFALATVPWLNGAAVKWLVLALALFLLTLVRWTKADRIDLAAIALVGWAALSLLWSRDPLFGAERLAQCVGILAFFLAFRRYHGPIAPAAFVAILAVLLSTLWLPFGSFQNENFIAEFVLLCLPFLLMAPLGWFALPVVGAFLWENGSHVEFAAFSGVLGLGAWWFARSKWGEGAATLLSVLIAIGIASLVVWVGFEPMRYRIDLTLNTLILWLTSPLYGVGLGSFDYLYPSLMVFHSTPAAALAHEYPGAAHNDGIQLLAELGVIGAVLAGYLLWLATRRTETAEQKYALVALAVASGIAAVEFPLQTPSAVVIALALARLAPSETEQVGQLWPRLASGGIASVASVFALMALMGQFAFAAVPGLLNTNPPGALIANGAAYLWAPWDKQIRLQYFRTLANLQEKVPAQIDREYAERVYAVSASAVPLNPGLLIDRIAYLSRAGRCDEECNVILRGLVSRPMIPQVADLIAEVRGN